jgi:multimeric flavodoxin WrbA
MKTVTLYGNMRNNSNTRLLVEPFHEKLAQLGAEIIEYSLKDMKINPCNACWVCQDIHDAPGCPQQDDMIAITESVLECDLIVFATPIYSWYCTPPLKAAMDRLVYSMNKYYGEVEGRSLWAGKKLALITSCGYEIEAGAGVYEEGLRRYAKHSQLGYLGKFAVRDIAGKEYFTNDAVKKQAREFAQYVYQAVYKDVE